jgi:hypothetical protein
VSVTAPDGVLGFGRVIGDTTRVQGFRQAVQ